MKTDLWFNFYGKTLCRISVSRPFGALERIYGGCFEHYRCRPEGKRADVALEIGCFEPDPPEGFVVVDKSFAVAPNYLLWHGEKGKGATEIRGIEQGPTLIKHVPYSESGLRRLMPGLRAIGMYALPLIKYSLFTRTGMHLLHGGGVEKDGKAVLFFGSNGTHKTRLILDLCLNYGFSFLGDDLITINGRMALPFIENERVLRVRYSRLSSGGALPVAKCRLMRAYAGRRIPDDLQMPNIGRESGIIAAIVLDRRTANARTPDINCICNSIDTRTLWQRVRALETLEVNRFQRRHRQLMNFGQILMAYQFGIPKSKAFTYFHGPSDGLYPELPSGFPAFSMVLPNDYDCAAAKAVTELTGEHF